jgi:hypothetical protein
VASEFPELHRIFIRAKLPENVIAYSALKRMQVGTQECWHDAGEHHLSLAPRTGRTLNRSARNDGRQGLKFWHSASFRTGEKATLSITGRVQRAEP